jgi:hypothetical protein
MKLLAVSKIPNSPAENLTPLWQLWWAFFAYTAIVALIVQLLLLPYVFPAWHAGNGLMVGQDSLYFHELAVELAQKIHTQGWSAWELRPQQQAPAGIASVIYALTVPQPWTLIPLNAVLHATSAIILLRIIQVFLPSWRVAIWCVLPFLLYPSAMTWNTQLLKDTYFISGNLLFLYGWIALAQLKTWNCQWWRLFLPIVWMVLGSMLVWLVRPFVVQLFQVVGALFAIAFTGLFIVRGVRAQLPWRKALIGIVVVWAVLALISPLNQKGGGLDAEIPKPVQVSKSKAPRKVPTAIKEPDWYASQRVPQFLDTKLYSLALTRSGFLTSSPEAASNIDVQTKFRRAEDIIGYLPRAIQIGLLAPFPKHWFAQGTMETTTMMRRISALEMTGVYLALLFLPYALWRWRQHLELWITLIFCSSLLLVFTIGVPNVGTLYRMRYGFLMTLVGLGIAGCLAALQRLRLQRLMETIKLRVSFKKHG